MISNKLQALAAALLLVVALLLTACTGEDSPDEPEPGDGDGTTSVQLRDWVEAMISAGDDAEPDTVEDKLAIVEDTDDPAAFDHLLEE